MRFDVDVVRVEGTSQTAAILKDKASAVPEKLKPVIDALREYEDQAELNASELNVCLDQTAGNRTARMRARKKLEEAGVLEPIEDEDGNVRYCRFHNPTSV